MERRFADGTVYEIVSSPFADSDQTPCMLAAYRNVTREKLIELELMELSQIKSDLLLEKTRELEQISKDVAKLREEKRRIIRFLSAITHDLRAPLSATQSCLWPSRMATRVPSMRSRETCCKEAHAGSTGY